MPNVQEVPSLWKRPFDLILWITAVMFAYISFAFDSLLAFGIPLSANSEYLMSRLFFNLYAGTADPLLVENPLFLQVQAVICVLIFGPFYAVLAYALWKGKNWIRIPALMFASVAFYCISVVMGVNIFGGYSPENVFMFYAGNVPYVLFPLALAYRMRTPQPFRETEYSVAKAKRIEPEQV